MGASEARRGEVHRGAGEGSKGQGRVALGWRVRWHRTLGT